MGDGKPDVYKKVTLDMQFYFTGVNWQVSEP
jgi:hypothetical protein